VGVYNHEGPQSLFCVCHANIDRSFWEWQEKDL
jgi:hypothetical protein